MTLEKRVISYPLTQGIDTGTDPKLVAPPQLLRMENARRDKNGRISKRFGHEAIGVDVTGSANTIEDSDALGVFGDELLVFAKQSVYSYSPQAEVSAEKGPCVSAITTLDDIVRNNSQQTQVDSAVLNDIAVVAYEDSRNGAVGIWISVRDNVSGATLLGDYLLSATGQSPRCLAFQTSIYVFWADGNDIKCIPINPYDPQTIPTATTVSSSLSTANKHYDVIAHDTFILLAFNVQGAVQTRLHKLDNALAILSTINIAEQATNCLTVVRAANSRTHVLFHNASGVRGAIHAIDLTVVAAPFLIENIASVVGITAYRLPADTGIRCFYHISAAQTYNHLIKQNTVTNAGTPGTPSVFLRSVGLASKAWAYSPDTTDRGFVMVAHESTAQPTFFVVRNDGLVVAKSQPLLAGGLLARLSFPATVTERAAGKYQVALLSRRTVGVDDGAFVTLKGASLLTIDFSDNRAFSNVQLAGNTLIIGGVIQAYDQLGPVEAGFNLFPENISLAQTTGGSLTLLSTLSYIVCFEWTDGRGFMHRSAPSAAVSITLTGGNNRVNITVPTLRITQKQGTITTGPRRDNCQIVVYRTENNGSFWYRASSPTSPSYNDPTADTVVITDDLSHANLIAREPLYSQGGILENIGPPSAQFAAAFRNRVFLGGTEDDTIWYSKQIRPGRPIEFSDALTFKMDPTGGRTTGIFPLDDKIILFKQDTIFYTGGDGPNDQGLGGVIPPPERLTVDAGCITAKSIAETPRGIMFKSRKGFYMLSRGMETQYIGSQVEAWADYDVTAAVLVADDNEVRFCLVDGPTLVYNYVSDEWYVWPEFRADDAVNWRGVFTAIRQRIGGSSRVVTQATDTFRDIDQYYSLRIGLGWAQFAQLQGLQRIWRASFLGDYKSPHLLKISVSYNFQPVVSDEYYWDPSVLGITAYGDGAFYGTDSPYGGGFSGVYQARVHLSQQKCQAATFVLEDINQSGSGESYSLSGCAFEVGIKRGAVKLSPERSL